MLHVHHLTVVKVAQFLILSEHRLHVFYLPFVRLWDGARNLLKFKLNNREGLVLCLQCPVHLFLAWSMLANPPNNGVSLYLQNSICKGYLV